MRCQLQVLPAAGTEFTYLEKLHMRLCQRVHYLLVTLHKLWDNPKLVLHKAQRVLGLARRRIASPSGDPVALPLGLQPGERVRVKPGADIRATLDGHGRYEGLGYMSATMDRYCGGTYTVLRRVDRFFDERTQRMLKLKNTVILDEVYCEPEPQAEERIAGCNRMCFLFWKEAWLERIGSDPRSDA
jgi:hypothetical protein